MDLSVCNKAQSSTLGFFGAFWTYPYISIPSLAYIARFAPDMYSDAAIRQHFVVMAFSIITDSYVNDARLDCGITKYALHFNLRSRARMFPRSPAGNENAS
jgi:hypothetical protein